MLSLLTVLLLLAALCLPAAAAEDPLPYTCGEMLRMARNGEPLDFGYQVQIWHLVLISLAIGFAVAFILCSGWRKACRKQAAQPWIVTVFPVPAVNFNKETDQSRRRDHEILHQLRRAAPGRRQVLPGMRPKITRA